MKGYINFRLAYTDKSGADQRSWRKYSVVTIPDEKWHPLCMNVHDQVLHDVYLNDKADSRYKTYVEIVSVARDSQVNLYIDDVFIWRDAVLGRYPCRDCENRAGARRGRGGEIVQFSWSKIW